MKQTVYLVTLILSMVYLVTCSSVTVQSEGDKSRSNDLNKSTSGATELKDMAASEDSERDFEISIAPSAPIAAAKKAPLPRSRLAGSETDTVPELRKSERISMDETKEINSSTAVAISPERTRKVQSRSGLKASFSDDNKQFNRFIGFLDKYRNKVQAFPLDVHERIRISVIDAQKRPIGNAKITIFANGQSIDEGLTYADGTFLFFPSLYDNKQRVTGDDVYSLSVYSRNSKKEITFDRKSQRQLLVQFDQPRLEIQQVPLDILFVLDTTGSMGEEINRLKKTIELIKLNLTNLPSRPAVRFGMVLYKDRGDEYISKVIALTSDMESFQQSLNSVDAAGGGDTPEDLQAALFQSIHTIEWSDHGLRLAFIITDAPPQLKYEKSYPYTRSARDAKEKGIKYFTIGTGGLNIDGEYVLRQISQFTSGKYIFLTYGESGESEGGRVGSVSHHSGANYTSDKLEAIIIRFAKDELDYLNANPQYEMQDDYFQAAPVDYEKNSDTLKKLFDQAIEQLIDYSSIRIAKETTVAVVPIMPSAQSKHLLLNAEYFTTQATQSISMSRQFILTERSNMQNIMNELKLQTSGTISEESVAEIGKLLGANLLFIGNLFEEPSVFNLFLKLVKVETGEVLAVTKARIDKRLGISLPMQDK